MNDQANAEMIVGRLLCGPVRRYLDREKFMGADIEYMESGGFIEHVFAIRGSSSDVSRIYKRLTDYFEEKRA